MPNNKSYNQRKYIELFAGCGGLSLGLESVGWQLELANELSPMAAETFAYNLLGEVSKITHPKESKVCNVEEITTLNAEEWKNKKLAVGDVVQLVSILKDNPKLVDRFKGMDLVSGGPPCQGFSMAGKRTEREPKNKLPYAFVDFVELVKPKAVILENVEGILRSFRSDGGTKEPWLEIAKAFAIIGYAPLCFLLNARQFGIPQNRPRFIMLGIEKSLKNEILEKTKLFKRTEIKKIFVHAFSFVENTSEFISQYSGKDPAIHIDVIKTDFATSRNIELKEIFNNQNLFPEVDGKEISVEEAIDDLSNRGGFRPAKKTDLILDNTQSSKYSQSLSEQFSPIIKHPENHKAGLYNHELRKHSTKITNRFILLQELKKIGDNFDRGNFEACLRGKPVKEKSLNKSRKKLSKSNRLKNIIDFDSTPNMVLSIEKIRSKKHTQRAISKDIPAPAQVTIPDDTCHYSDNQPRVLTVREMARIQSFPDDFVFRSKVTTGGKNRKFEVPQYTQVGNAVPPLLGKVIGEWVMSILE